MTTAKREFAPSSGVLRQLIDAAKGRKPRRAMTTAQRRVIQREAANDPNVDRALRELLTEHPELRTKPQP
jgi:hypothetical protein